MALPLPLLSGVSIVWWRMGEQVEPFGSDQNLSQPLAEANATPFGVAGAVLRCVVIAQLVRTRIELGRLRFVAAAVWIGAMLGIGLRGLTMTTAGANIGEGIFLVFGLPILTVAMIVLAIRVARRRSSLV